MSYRNMDFFNHFDTLIFTNSNRLPLSKNNGFGIYFYQQLLALSTDKELNLIDIRLMLFLIACLSKKEHKSTDNSVHLLNQKSYAEQIGTSQPKISKSLKNLEKKGYIIVDKEFRKVIIINPQLAYSDKFKNYTETHNRLANLFNYNQLEIRIKSPAKSQDWSSDVPRQIEEKRRLGL